MKCVCKERTKRRALFYAMYRYRRIKNILLCPLLLLFYSGTRTSSVCLILTRGTGSDRKLQEGTLTKTLSFPCVKDLMVKIKPQSVGLKLSS